LNAKQISIFNKEIRVEVDMEKDKNFIDLRSDTVTKPTLEMRRAMMEAEVGDDVYMEDPTVNHLQEKAAQMMGKESALFMASGTLANEVAIKVLTQPGQEVIMDENCHIFNYEVAGLATLSGVMPRPLPGKKGILSVEQIKNAVRPKIYYLAQTGLITLENTNNLSGGTIYPLEITKEIVHFAKNNSIPIHLDGARIFNAAIASGHSAKELCEGFDTIMFCLSKGLGAPVGSILLGKNETIEKASSIRRMFGGGMRQVGVLASAGLVALEKQIDRLAEDHDNASLLANGIALIDGLNIDPREVNTNILIFSCEKCGLKAGELTLKLKEAGVLALPTGEFTVRMVTHLDVNREDIINAVDIINEVAKKHFKKS
jgi:threonine aldolase